jgi:hypothetical protein
MPPSASTTHYTVTLEVRRLEPRGEPETITWTGLAPFPHIAEQQARAYAAGRGLLPLRILCTTGRPARPDEMLRAAGVPGLFDEDH